MANAVLDKPQKFPLAPYANGLSEDTVSPERYLARERIALNKHEYINGKMREMSGASRVHNLLTGKIITVLTVASEGRDDCEVYPSDMRVSIPATNRYTYPDVIAVVGEEPQFTDDVFDTIRNPTLIVEVLSSSTEDYDRGEKLDHYKTIPSLREYVLVSQSEYKVTVSVRDATGAWQENSATALASSVSLDSLGVTVALADLYRRVGVAAPTS
ncbi:MAG: Uma2 family endonuclease [Armatimonadetes bacterium]|nr:Uma2 family endonuclease [Armatimonadota bacterium]